MSKLSEVLRQKSSAELRDLLRAGRDHVANTLVSAAQPASTGGNLRSIFGDDELGQGNAEKFRQIVGAWQHAGDSTPRMLNVVHAIEAELGRTSVSKTDVVVRQFAIKWLRPRIHADYIAKHDGELRYAVSAVADKYFPRDTRAVSPEEQRTKLIVKLELLVNLV